MSFEFGLPYSSWRAFGPLRLAAVSVAVAVGSNPWNPCNPWMFDLSFRAWRTNEKAFLDAIYSSALDWRARR
jgi:hypothetical protein